MGRDPMHGRQLPMPKHKPHVAFPGKVLILGFGSIGQALVPVQDKLLRFPIAA